MKDIKNAVLAAQEYNDNYDPNGKSLRQYLAPYGYADLEEFFKDEIDYEISQLNLELTTCGIEDGFDMIMEHIKTKTPGAFVSREKKLDTWIYTGKDKMLLNVEEANNLGCLIREFDYGGGPIISTKDDFSFVLVVPEKIKLTAMHMQHKFVRFLNEQNISAQSTENDLMVNGYKVAGSIIVRANDMRMFAIEISMADHSDLVSRLSTKVSNKPVGCLSGISKKSLEQEVSRWLHTI